MQEKNNLGGITISTDASFCPRTKVGGWASYVVCNHFKFKISGKLKGFLLSPQEAEIKAIGNVLHYILSSPHIPEFSYIYVNTDCKNGAKAIENPSTPLEWAVNKSLQLLATRTNCPKVEFRYVAAHTSSTTPRSYVNEWCDKQAKKHMAVRRKEVKDQESAKPKPCTVCPWIQKGQPDITEELKSLAKSGEWFCCHKNLGTCIGAANYKSK
jgi:ribonuclease HI